MHQYERGYLIVPHEVATGAECDGCLIIEERGDVADLKCNSCGVVIDTVPIERASARLREIGPTEICSAQCPHCGRLNLFPGFSIIEAFVYGKRGLRTLGGPLNAHAKFAEEPSTVSAI